MEVTRSQAELTPGLKASVREGMYHAAMAGSGEAYTGACVIFLQATTLQVGLLSSLPAAVSGLLQVLSLHLVRRLTSRRSVIVGAATVQSWCWLAISLVPLFVPPGPSAVATFIGLLIAYYLAAGVFAPTWSSLIGDSVPAERRGEFFGFRSQRSGLCTFIALSLAGQLLEIAKRLGITACGFSFIFLSAAWFRFRSLRWLERYDDPAFHHDPEQQFSLFQFLVRLPYSNFGRFALFVACISFAVSFSGPYFSLYLLRDLHLSYIHFTLVTATATLTQFLIMQHWGRLTDLFGSKRIMTVCGVGIAVNPALWLFSHNLPYLVGIQVFSGVFWAGFNLAASTFLFDAVTPQKRARCAAYQALLCGLFHLAGSMSGAFVATRLPESFTIGSYSWTPTSSLLIIFLLSGILRTATVAMFLPTVREVREVSDVTKRELLFRILHIRPLGGILFGIIGGSVETKLNKSNKDSSDGEK